jgi:hypothetical protein
MSLQDGIDRCEEILRWAQQARHGSFAAPTTGGVIVRLQDMQALAHGWGGAAVVAPDGSPADVRRSAATYGVTADGLRSAATRLREEAAAVEDVLEGDAAQAAVVAVAAFADLAELEATGADVVGDALASYASALAAAQAAHATSAGALDDARSAVLGLDVPDWSDDLEPGECRALIARADGLLDEAIGAATGCRDALRDALDAETTLRFALGDAAGHARLAGFTPSTATTTVDAVLALAAGVDDPDQAVVSADEWAAYLAARQELSAADRDRLDAALADARSPEERQMVISAVATGAGLALTLALARRLSEMSSDDVRRIGTMGILSQDRDFESRVRTIDGSVVKQRTGTTCGSASLLMLAAQRDPFLALFLARGELVDGHVPEYVSDVPLVHLMPDAGLTSAQRLEYLQTQIRIQTNRFTFWPGSVVGSSPWGYGDEVSRVVGADVAMEYSLLGPHDDPADLVDRAVAAVDAGTPVPFLVGPAGTDVPRHYVLLVGHADGVLEFYEPGVGAIHTLALDDARAGGADGARAFGGWDAIYGAAVPR